MNHIVTRSKVTKRSKYYWLLLGKLVLIITTPRPRKEPLTPIGTRSINPP
jgi:hypothetical protein